MKGLQTTKLHEVAFLSNTIIRSPLYLSNIEARLFALALGCLHQKEDSLDFSVHFNDVTATSRNGGSQYTVLHEARARLTQPLITQGKSKGKRRSDAIPLFTIITLDEGTSLVTGQFNPILKEYLLGLAGKFTTVELESLLTLKSAHSQRLFWILRSYHNQTWQEPISFEQLREWLFGENSDVYPLWNDFNRYVLKPALLEFQAIGWAVDVTIEKRGRRTDALLFKMTNTQSSAETPELGKSKKALTLSEIAEFRELLVTKYKELPALYDRLRLDFELKEYQAREVVNNITDLTTYQLVTKVLYEVRLALADRKPLKSLAAYTLSQLKAVLPVYQVLSEPVGTPTEPIPKAKATKRPQQQQLEEARLRLQFVQQEAPTNLFSDQEKAARTAELEAEIAALIKQLGH
jgi:plasmid replication initiation protein